MSIRKCKECGGQVSSKADACPHCGAKPAKRTPTFAWVVGGLFAVVIGSCIDRANEAEKAREASQARRAAFEAARPPEQREAEARAKAKQEKDFQFAVVAAKLVRASMKDPASFSLAQAILTDRGTLCLTYRGKNSFGATVLEHKAITNALQEGKWDKECKGKSGDDMGKIQYAM